MACVLTQADIDRLAINIAAGNDWVENDEFTDAQDAGGFLIKSIRKINSEASTNQASAVVFNTVADMIAGTAAGGITVSLSIGQRATTNGYYAAGDGGGADYLAAASQAVDGYGDHTLGNGNVALLQVVHGVVSANQWGYIDDNSTDNALPITSLLTWARAQDALEINFSGKGRALTSTTLIPGSNVTLNIEGTIVNTATGGSAGAFGIFMGQGNREDIARSKGVEETANDAGTLVAGDTDITVGSRWNDTAGTFSNALTWTPQVGDLCMVCTTDDTAAEPTRPIPSFTHHRRIVKVSGLNVVIDKGVAGAGAYMIIPTSRDLGYDRTTYGGLGRMETIDNTVINGHIESQNGFPMLTGGMIDCEVNGQFDGLAVIFGNGVRQSKFNCSGLFKRNALELALGSEDFDVDLTAVHQDTGETYVTACVQIGERALTGRLGRIRVDAPLWDGNDSLAVFGVGHECDDVVIDTACVQRLCAIGSSGIPSDRFKSNNLDLGSTGAVTGRLIESTNSEDLDIHARLRGNTSNADAVLLQDSGTVRSLEVVDDGGVIRINGDYLINDVRGSGTLSTTGTRILRGGVKPKQRSGYLATESFATPFNPTQDFQMSLTAALSLDDPSGTYEAGDRVQVILAQDGVGSHAVTFAGGALYRGVVAPGSGTASKRWTADFMWTGAVWACVATNGGWA